MVESFSRVPPLQSKFSNPLTEQIMDLGGNMFYIALKLGAPLIAALLLTSVALGLIARTVPQMNILIVAMPLKIIVGLIFLGLTLPYISSFLGGVFSGMVGDILLLFKLMA